MQYTVAFVFPCLWSTQDTPSCLISIVAFAVLDSTGEHKSELETSISSQTLPWFDSKRWNNTHDDSYIKEQEFLSCT